MRFILSLRSRSFALCAPCAFCSPLQSMSPAVWSCCRGCGSSENVTVRLMSSTLLYNGSVVVAKDDSDVVVELVTFLSEQTKSEPAADVCARLLLALAECTSGNDSIAELLVGLEYAEALQQIKLKFALDKQLQQTASDLASLLTAAQQAAFSVQ